MPFQLLQALMKNGEKIMCSLQTTKSFLCSYCVTLGTRRNKGWCLYPALLLNASEKIRATEMYRGVCKRWSVNHHSQNTYKANRRMLMIASSTHTRLAKWRLIRQPLICPPCGILSDLDLKLSHCNIPAMHQLLKQNETHYLGSKIGHGRVTSRSCRQNFIRLQGSLICWIG